MDLNNRFMVEVSNIKSPELFLGVARILKVRLFEDGVDGAKGKESNDPRDFTQIFADVMFNYNKAGRKFRKELLKILRDANRAGDELDGSNSEDTTKGNTNQNV